VSFDSLERLHVNLETVEMRINWGIQYQSQKAELEMEMESLVGSQIILKTLSSSPIIFARIIDDFDDVDGGDFGNCCGVMIMIGADLAIWEERRCLQLNQCPCLGKYTETGLCSHYICIDHSDG
jgi:hypothetical protein